MPDSKDDWKDNEKRMAKLEASVPAIKEICSETRDDFRSMRHELFNYLKPVKVLTQKNSSRILSLEKDNEWIIPFIKKTLYAGGFSSLLGAIWYAAKAYAQYYPSP